MRNILLFGATAVALSFVLASVACLFAAPLPAGAALIMHKDLSLDIAKTIAEGAIAACNAKGYGTSAVVVENKAPL